MVPDLGLSVADPALAAGFYLRVRDERLWYLVIRSTSDPLTLAPALRVAVANIDVDLQLEEVRTLETADQEERVFLSGVALALTAMGGMALMLSIVGIYALLSFMVTRRTREIGIRIALGAQRWQVLRSITGAAAVYLLMTSVFSRQRAWRPVRADARGNPDQHPGAGPVDAVDDLPDTGDPRRRGVLAARAPRAQHPPFRGP